MADDERLDFLKTHVKVLCGSLQTENIKLNDINQSDDVQDFLDNVGCLALKVTITETGRIECSTKISKFANNTNDKIVCEIAFVKRSLTPLSGHNISESIDVHTLKGSPIESLYTVLKSIWCPILLENETWTEKLPSRVQQLLTELEANLSNSIHTLDMNTNIRNTTDLENVSNIIEPLDEFNFWRILKDDRRSPYCHLARIIDTEYSKLSRIGFEDIHTIDIQEMNDLYTLCSDCMNSAWMIAYTEDRPYPQKRMEHLFTILGSTFCRYFQKKLNDIDIWHTTTSTDTNTTTTTTRNGGKNGHVDSGDNQSTTTTHHDIIIQLEYIITLCTRWIDIPQSLIRLYWTSNTKYKWSGDIYIDTYMIAFKNRIVEVMNILGIFQEISSLLTSQEKQSFHIHILIQPLIVIRPLLYNPYTENNWKKTVQEFDRLLAPIEQLITNRFKQNFLLYQDSPSSLILEFTRYKTLLIRPSIKKLLISERESFYHSMIDMIKIIENETDNIENEYDTMIKNMNTTKKTTSQHGTNATTTSMNPYIRVLTPIANKIVKLRQLGNKVNEIKSICIYIINDIDGYENFKVKIDTLLIRLQIEEKQTYDIWLNDTQQKLEDDDVINSSKLSLQGSLLTWNQGLLTVSYSSELVIFTREVRQLQELGFEIPKKSKNKGGKSILEIASEAEKFYRFGVLLQKTATFYNSLSEQILDIQEQLLLDSLTTFVNLVSESNTNDSTTTTTTTTTSKNSTASKVISWNNPNECERYVYTLQHAAEKLAYENRILRQFHEILISEIIILMNIDFLKNTTVWKQKWKYIKEIMNNNIKNKYSNKDSKLYLLHWDNQLYKALEVSYQLGLESFNENITEIKIELIFNNKLLQFKPSFEQIRQNYYNEIKKFMNVPNAFDGFGNTQLYKKMSSKNIKRLYTVYKKSEILLNKLIILLKRYQSWVLPGMIDIDTFIDTYITQLDEYILNFKTLKIKRKSIDKIPDYEYIDCFTITLAPFKSYIEDLYQKIHDILLISLRRTLLLEFREVDLFLESSMERLNTRPQHIDEISSAKKQWKDIVNKKDNIKIISKGCIEKKKLLLQYTPGTVIDISEVTSRMANLDGEGGRWDEFDIALEAFNDLIEEQKEVLKGTIEEDTINLNIMIDKVTNRWKQVKPGNDIKSWDPMDIQQIFHSLEEWKNQLNEIQNKANSLMESCNMFAMPKPRFDGLETLITDITSTIESWDILKLYEEEIKIIGDQDWLTFSTNVYVLQDFAIKWNDKLKMIFQRGIYDIVADHIISIIEKIKKAIPCMKYCQGEPFKEDHWIELLQGKLQLNRDIRKENIKVSHFLSKLDILIEPTTLSFVKNLQSRALGEVQIREALQELRTWERSAEIILLLSDESNRKIPLIKEWKDLFIEIGDKQSLLNSLKDNQFYKAFSDQGSVLETKMINLDIIIHTLNSIQRKWVYLEPIFGRGALPSEESRFKRLDEEYSEIMITIGREPKLFYLVDEQLFPHLPSRLKDILDQLERCQKALTDFLEVKRSTMPRFYFIGDDDLLEILGQAKNPLIIQNHLKKLFQGINKVKFNNDNSKIIGMISSANEVVELETPVIVNDKVEMWLEDLTHEMRATLTSFLIKGVTNTKTIDWKLPSQIICLIHMIQFTQETEVAIPNGIPALQDYATQLRGKLHDLTSHDLSSEPLLQLKIKNLVFDMVHNIDVLEQLIKYNIQNINEWIWRKQLRYYLLKGGQVVVRMYDAQFSYTYEYQGNIAKLVHTPLTDKCYLTLTQGMHMGFGGNPYGPAGTGKTESVKALASNLGRQVLVFNCDEALESTSMIRIFMGIIKCGAWGCFDEFNRLKEDQLSAISQQIQIIQDAIKLKISPIQLLGKSIEVDFNSGIFVTLNPAGKGYGGRSRLPDNLKALFRPVAMGAPDNELIAEVSLVTEGFTQAKELASKITSLFKLSRQLLSPQQHYDWGLRGLKAILNSGGRLIQSYQQQNLPLNKDIEYEILIKALRVNTLSKLTYDDTMKFLPLIEDVFPGVKSADVSGGELEQAIKEIMKEKSYNLIEDTDQIKKMIQLKESLDQRIGCVIVGPSGSGKSTLWRVLKAAMIKCGQPVVTYVMNPKSMKRERLLGHMDIDTREWSDGVLTDAARQVVKELNTIKCWIICDGDVDPEWIESLNSVLDDNHLLTLPNGERIAFGSNINFLFETHDLKYASPATVSRMGMIFLSDEELDISRVIQKWMTSLPSDRQLSMIPYLDEYFYKSLSYMMNMNEMMVDTTLVGTVMNALAQLKNVSTKVEFIGGLIRGLGGNLSISNRISLAKEIYQWANERPPDMSNPLDCYADGNNFIAYTNHIPSVKDLGQYTISDLGERYVVNTISVQRTLASIEPLITHMEPFILIGPEGCGKSMIIHHAFKQKKNMNVAVLHCNAQTSADDVINKIIQTCSLFSAPEGRVYRPRDCERLILYIKDINLPRPDMYETCQLIAFLQQLITFEGFYNDELEFLRLQRVQIVASMNAATTVGRHPLSTRFVAIVNIINVDYPETNELVTIYDSFLSIVLNAVTITDRKWLQATDRERLATAIVEIYQKTKEKFTVDDQRHYLFTLRDITTLIKNMSRYNLQTENLLDVLSYECGRLFRDRLINTEACNRFDQIVSGILRTSFRHTALAPGTYFTSLSSSRTAGGSGSGTSTTNSSNDGKDANTDQRLVPIGIPMLRMTETDFRTVVTQGLVYYEREERDLNMLLFTEILEHISHIDRVLSGDGGHCLLVGRSGVGRRNAVTIAAYMLGYQFTTLAISRYYTTKHFITDIKAVMMTAGIKGEPVVLFLEDFHMITESILEIINSLISAGEVPGMYTHEELDPLLIPLREKMREYGDFKTPYDFFLYRIRKYLHIVICMDPNHPKFLYRCESNPSLYSQCTVIWMGEWKTNTLQTIPSLIESVQELLPTPVMSGGNSNNSLGDEEKSAIDDDDNNLRGGGGGGRGEGKYSESKSGNTDRKSTNQQNKDKDKSSMTKSNKIKYHKSITYEIFMDILLQIHMSSITQQNATPRDYISFLKLWSTLLSMKRTEVSSELGHLEAGLEKLESAAAVVNDLRTNAVQQEKDLRIAQQAADRAMEDISKALLSSSDRRNEVAEVKKTVAENEKKTQARKAEIEEELADIQPLLDSAKQAVGSIKSEHLAEIRSLAAPPEAIADVLAAVLMMLGVQDLSWLSMKKFLSNRGVKEDILNYDASKMSDETRKNVAKLMKKKPTSFEDAVIARASAAAAPMAAWVKANIKYSIVVEKITPLQAELEEETLKLTESQDRLRRCEEELKEIDVRVSKLQTEFGNRTAEAVRLKQNLEIAATTLDKAEKLIGQLSGEQTRWKIQVSHLYDDLEQLPIKMVLAAGFITYLSKSPEDTRTAMITKWLDITKMTIFEFKRMMSTESELLTWKSMGLPSDDLSQENGLAIQYTYDRFPFIIDPASVSTEWLKAILSKDKTRPLEVITQHDSRFTNQVELAVRFGKTLLILEVDGIETMLYPLCRKDLIHQGARYCVSVGDKIIDYNENFRLVLVTRNPYPDLPPDAASLILQINFTVTKSGLEGQLLGLAIQHEQPELEKAKGEMLKKEEDFKVQLASLEKELLQALATAEGNLLQNTVLIESLTRTKEKSAEIEYALQQSAEASSKLDEQREVYRDFAHTGSKLYFLVKDLKRINNMYQFSLSSFLSLFKKTLSSNVNGVKDTKERLVVLGSNLEISTLSYVGRGLFKSDRLMFTMHMIKRMHSDQFQGKEWDIFTGLLVSSITDGIPKGYPSWANSERYAAYRVVQEALPHLINSLELDTQKWIRFSTSVEAERDIPPIRGITPFQRVLIVQIFRPDRLQSAMIQFCNEILRVESIAPPTLSLSSLYQEGDMSSPIMLISTPGADPSKELEEFAEKSVGSGQYEELAMGGGQLDPAIHLIRNAAASGTWVCLKNLHLVISWLPTLEKELSSLQPQDGFRLWLTTENHPEFPSILLQSSLKCTYESPPGIKMNLIRTFTSWDKELFTLTNASTSNIKNKLLFLLACFHSIIQERRTYIPQGWSKFHEFSYGDLKAGTYVMEAAATMNKNGRLDWEAIYGLLEEAIYGGRIENNHDMRVLKAYLSIFFNDEILDDNGRRDILPGTPLRMPMTPEYDSFLKIINQMPDKDSPYVFGLPDNIERSLQRSLSSAVISQLRTLSSVSSGTIKFDREKWKTQLGPILDLWQQLTSTTPGLISKASKNTTKQKQMKSSSTTTNSTTNNGNIAVNSKKQNPVDDFVNMENDIASEICTMVDTALNMLKKVLFGLGLLTPYIQQIASALLSLTVPTEWTKKWDTGPEKPQAWLKELIRKRITLIKWRTSCTKGSLLTEALNLSDVFNPSTFINALRQLTARTSQCAIDQMKMISSWDRDSHILKSKCPHPCMLSSLLLQGAILHNKGYLQESPPDASELCTTSVVTIGFVPITTAENTAASSTVSIPLFVSTTREEYLMNIDMPMNTTTTTSNDTRNSNSSTNNNSKEELSIMERKWILAGVALFLRVDE